MSAALHRYDTLTKVRSFVIDANDVIVLNDCKRAENRDSLVVLQHRYFVVAEATTGTGCSTPPAKRKKVRSANTATKRQCVTPSRISTLCDTHKD